MIEDLVLVLAVELTALLGLYVITARRPDDIEVTKIDDES